MKSFLTVILGLLLVFVISFNFEVLREKEHDTWRHPISVDDAPEIDITGRWHDTQNGLFNGGRGYLDQKKNRINGAFGDYVIKGTVSGKKIYLAFLFQGVVQYTARLEVFQDLLIGNFFEADDALQKRGVRLCLEKEIEPTL